MIVEQAVCMNIHTRELERGAFACSARHGLYAETIELHASEGEKRDRPHVTLYDRASQARVMEKCPA